MEIQRRITAPTITDKYNSFTAVKVPFCNYGPKTYCKRIRFDQPDHKQIFILNHQRVYRFYFFVSPIFLAYYTGLIIDSCTKPPIETVISIRTTIVIDYSTHLIPWIWSLCCLELIVF